jgi:HD superfamily phosphodiesterase
VFLAASVVEEDSFAVGVKLAAPRETAPLGVYSHLHVELENLEHRVELIAGCLLAKKENHGTS